MPLLLSEHQKRTLVTTQVAKREVNLDHGHRPPPKGQSKVSVLERCPFYRGHHDDVTVKTPLTVFKCLVTKNTRTHASKFINMQYWDTVYNTMLHLKQ